MQLIIKHNNSILKEKILGESFPQSVKAPKKRLEICKGLLYLDPFFMLQLFWQ